MIYDTSPHNVDAENVSKVVNYVVAYSCKGNEREIQEKQNLKALILEAKDEQNNVTDVIRLA